MHPLFFHNIYIFNSYNLTHVLKTQIIDIMIKNGFNTALNYSFANRWIYSSITFTAPSMPVFEDFKHKSYEFECPHLVSE